MGHFSMEIYAPTGSNLSGNQQAGLTMIEPLYNRVCQSNLSYSCGDG